MPQTGQGHSQSKRTNSEGLRAIHVLVPEDAHLQARRAALESRMPFRIYMGHLMSAAQPIFIDVAEARVEETAPEDIPIHGQAVPVIATSDPLASPAELLIEPTPRGLQTTDLERAVDDSFDLFK
jgi:hypothetical protein